MSHDERVPQPVCVCCRNPIRLNEIPMCQQCRQDNPIASVMAGAELKIGNPTNPNDWSSYQIVKRARKCSECAELVTHMPHYCGGPVGA